MKSIETVVSLADHVDGIVGDVAVNNLSLSCESLSVDSSTDCSERAPIV